LKLYLQRIRLETNAFTSAREENLMRGFVALPILAIISLALLDTAPAREATMFDFDHANEAVAYVAANAGAFKMT
jgi:hypothetical protein